MEVRTILNTLTKMLNKKNFRTVWFIYSLLSLALVLFLLDYITGKTLSEKYIPANWNVSINNKQYDNVELDSFRFKSVSKGDTITLSTTLTDPPKLQSPSIYIPVSQSTVNACIDNQLFFEFGHERYSDNRPIGSGFQIVSLPQDFHNRELKITMEVTENNAFSSIDNIWICEWKDSYRFILAENRLAFLASSFLIVFGLILTILLLFVTSKTLLHIDILLISLFSICMGLWTMSYNNMFELFSVEIHTTSLIENVSILIAPLLILAYMNIYIKQLDNKKITTIYRGLNIAQFIISIGIIALHAVNIAHIYEMITFHYTLFIIHICFFSYVLHSTDKYVKRQKIIYNIGIAIFLVSVVYDLITYIVTRYNGHKLLNIEGISVFGIITFICILLLDLYNDITLRKMEQQEKELLIKRAYTDELTQINNRRFCSEYMDKLQEDNNQEYSIISLDVNNLKQINDTYGHAKGDILIKSAADVISKAFKTGIVGRMGGDEFIVILHTDKTDAINTLINSFKNILDEINAKTEDLYVSIAYGYATYSDVEDKNIESVYKLADERMYEHKKVMKSMQSMKTSEI